MNWIGAVLALAASAIIGAGWWLYRRTIPTPTLYTPDVATDAAREAQGTPMKYDIDLESDLIVDAAEQEECERLYGRLRAHADVALQRSEREQLL